MCFVGVLDMEVDYKELIGKGIALLVLRYIVIPANAIALTLALFQGNYNLPYIMVLIGVAPLFIYLYSYAFSKYTTIYIDGYSRDIAKDNLLYKIVNKLTALKHFNVTVLFSGIALLLVGGIVFGLFDTRLVIVKLGVMCLLTSAMWTIGLNLDI